jgi:hypothetical protein
MRKTDQSGTDVTYDHNFLRKNWRFDHFLKISFVFSQKCQFFRRKYFKNHNIGPRSPCLEQNVDIYMFFFAETSSAEMGASKAARKAETGDRPSKKARTGGRTRTTPEVAQGHKMDFDVAAAPGAHFCF